MLDKYPLFINEEYDDELDTPMEILKELHDKWNSLPTEAYEYSEKLKYSESDDDDGDDDYWWVVPKDAILEPIDDELIELLKQDEKNRREKLFIERHTKSIQEKPMLSEKDSRNGQKILCYLKEKDWEFALKGGIPYFYNEYNGTWYPLTSINGQRKFLSALSSKEKELINGDSVEKLAEAILSDIGISSRQFEAPVPYLLNFNDAVFDISTEEKLPHSSKYMFTYCLNASTNDISDDYRRGEMLCRYLDSSFDGNQSKIDTLGEIFGLALSTIRDQKQMFFLYGPASSGKSVALNILKGLISDEFVTSLSFKQLGGRFELSELNGSWLNLSSEIPNIKGKAADVIKRITGNDDVHAERKGKTGYKTHINALLVFATNTLPHAAGDFAFYSRFRVLKYDHTIPRNEWINNIERTILAEELGCVLRFAIEGLKRYVANGMEITSYDESEICIENSRIEENSFSEFSNRYITVSEGNIIMNSELFGAYEDYCKRNHLKAVDLRTRSQILTSYFNAQAYRHGKNRDRGYIGISLNYSYDVT